MLFLQLASNARSKKPNLRPLILVTQCRYLCPNYSALMVMSFLEDKVIMFDFPAPICPAENFVRYYCNAVRNSSFTRVRILQLARTSILLLLNSPVLHPKNDRTCLRNIFFQIVPLHFA